MFVRDRSSLPPCRCVGVVVSFNSVMSGLSVNSSAMCLPASFVGEEEPSIVWWALKSPPMKMWSEAVRAVISCRSISAEAGRYTLKIFILVLARVISTPCSSVVSPVVGRGSMTLVGI